jgi:hypothetical protein
LTDFSLEPEAFRSHFSTFICVLIDTNKLYAILYLREGVVMGVGESGERWGSTKTDTFVRAVVLVLCRFFVLEVSTGASFYSPRTYPSSKFLQLPFSLSFEHLEQMNIFLNEVTIVWIKELILL